MSEQLFEIDLTPASLTDRIGRDGRPPKPSRDRARTDKRTRMIEAGFHPTGQGPIHHDGTKCGTCVNCILVNGGARNYWKCKRLPITGGPGSDIRKSWPACPYYERQPS